MILFVDRTVLCTKLFENKIHTSSNKVDFSVIKIVSTLRKQWH